MGNTTKEKKQVPDTFRTVPVDDKWGIQHTATEKMLSGALKNKDTVEEVTYTLNELSTMGKKAWTNKIAKEGLPENLKKILVQAFPLVHPEKVRQEQVLLAKEKGRDSYANSPSRMAFKADSVTPKEEQILRAVDKLQKAGKVASCARVAEIVGMQVNQVSGANSVLLAKGFTLSVRVKDPDTNKAVREIRFAPGFNLDKIPVKASAPAKTPKKDRKDDKKESADLT